MVVEDDQSSREALRMLLETEGYAVVTAKDGADALQKLHDGVRPGLILLDLRMRGLSGPEFRKLQLEEEPAIAQVPIVLFTGAGNAAEASERLGASAFVTKPIDVDLLLVLVARFLPH